MKKLFITIPALALFLASCGGKCDVSTAEGAAECYCSLTEEYIAAKDAEDEDKLKEIDEKMDKMQDEAEKHIEAGDYSENDVEKLLKDCLPEKH